MRHSRIFAILFATMLFSGCATNNGGATGNNIGYWGTTSGKVWKSGFGGCWRNSNWTPDQAGDCGGMMMAPAEPEMTGYFWADDQDRDGVLDGNDACPFTPEGVAVDSKGCANDNDGDGVPDYLDQCPETPLGTVVDTTGCAYKIVTLSGVNFAFDSSTLTSEARGILDRAATKINSHSASHFTVEGHTDSNGSDAYNQLLSERRAKSVMNYLISRGVSASNLSAVGKGESFPIASNDSREGRAANRRVVVIAK